MNAPLARISRALVIGGAALLLASNAYADPSAEACERALVSRIQNENRGAGRVDFEGGMNRGRQDRKGDSDFNGNGQWKTGKGKMERFNYACRYDHKDGRVKSVSYQRRDQNQKQNWNQGPGRDNDRAERDRRDVRMNGECQNAMKAKIKKEHSNASKIELESGQSGSRANSEDGMRGEGSFVNGSGDKRHFAWDCSYNRDGRISSLSYDKPSGKK